MRFQRFVVTQSPETAYTRQGLFAIELLDGVTMSRVTDGVTVGAEGLTHRTPVINAGGLFTWLHEDITRLTKLTIDPERRPYQKAELKPEEIVLGARPITSVALAPRGDYAFAAGTTAFRGRVVEARVSQPVPVVDGKVRLSWLDEDNNWVDDTLWSSTRSKGEYLLPLRAGSTGVPQLDASGRLTLRFRVTRADSSRRTQNLTIPAGRVTDSLAEPSLMLVWDELHL